MQPKKLHLLMIFLLIFPGIFAQPEYTPPTDPLVQKNLDEWQDLKFGFMMHWGPYSQWGIVESWSLCSEDEPWCHRNAENYTDYKKAYELLQTIFNPVRFNPESWAAIARDAGMRYVVFTTKHHDGFCMFDTQLTDYKITSRQSPFHTNKKADITRAIFDAFRAEGFKTGAYFSKPDWHSTDYWWPYFATPDRHVNYNPDKYPERWQRFKDFVFGQIEELTSRYGKLDILWLDGGWVRPRPGVDTHPWNQDINMEKIAGMARNNQPGIIIVDRTVSGPYENYRTPEQSVPEQPLTYPWETCMTMGNSWSYNPYDHYKSVHQLIHLLVDIVAKGGNFLLNVGPSPTGELPPEAVKRMKAMGEWMKINGQAIYDTRPVAPYKKGNICYTRQKNGTINAIYLAGENEKKIPGEVHIPYPGVTSGISVALLGSPETLTWKKEKDGFVVHVPAGVADVPPCNDAWVFTITSPE